MKFKKQIIFSIIFLFMIILYSSLSEESILRLSKEYILRLLEHGSLEYTPKEIANKLKNFKKQINKNIIEMYIVDSYGKKSCLTKIKSKKIISEFKDIIVNYTSYDYIGIAKQKRFTYFTLKIKDNYYSFEVGSKSGDLRLNKDIATISFFKNTNFDVSKAFCEYKKDSFDIDTFLQWKYRSSTFTGQYKNEKLLDFLNKYIFKENSKYLIECHMND